MAPGCKQMLSKKKKTGNLKVNRVEELDEEFILHDSMHAYGVGTMSIPWYQIICVTYAYSFFCWNKYLFLEW